MRIPKILPHDRLKLSNELPNSVRTLRRAQLLLLISELGPTTNHHLCKFGSSLNTIRRLTREFSIDGLVFENHHLYRVTSKGARIIKMIINDPIMMDYIKSEDLHDLEMERPTITKL